MTDETQRRPGRTKLVYDKTSRTIVTVATAEPADPRPSEPVGEVTEEDRRLACEIANSLPLYDYNAIVIPLARALAALRTRLERHYKQQLEIADMTAKMAELAMDEARATAARIESERDAYKQRADEGWAAASNRAAAEERAERAEAALAAEREHWKQIHTGCHAERDELEQVMLHEKAMRESLQAQLHGMQDGAALRDALTRITALEAERDRLLRLARHPYKPLPEDEKWHRCCHLFAAPTQQCGLPKDDPIHRTEE